MIRSLVRINILLCTMLLACCVQPAPLEQMAFDLYGTWAAQPDDMAASESATASFRQFRLVISQAHLLNPIGEDCRGTPGFQIQRQVPLDDLIVTLQLPKYWRDSIAPPAAVVDELHVTCGGRQILHLFRINDHRVLMAMDGGMFLLLHKTALRPG